MGINSGMDSKLQVGKETTWGTGVAPTVAIDFTSETLKQRPVIISEDALVGRVTKGRRDIQGYVVDGGFDMIVKPDNIGLLLSAALGAEASPSGVGATSTIYDHAFSCLAGGSSNSLPHLTIVVDRKSDVAGYVSCKVNTMTLSAKLNDYLRATFEVLGRQEQGDAVESLSISTKRAFQFRDGHLTIGGSTYTEVQSIDLTVNNNLETDRFVLDGSAYVAEMEPQERVITANLDVLFSSDINTLRESYFQTGTSVALVLTFTSSEEAGESQYYTLTISIPLGYIIECYPNVGGPERIPSPMVIEAAQDSSNQPITITLRDDQATAYIS